MKDHKPFLNAWEKAALAIVGIVNVAMMCSLVNGIIRNHFSA